MKYQKTVLIVEDELTTNEILVNIIKKLGYNTVSALSAEDGIRKAIKDNIDIVMMDIELGSSINGMEAAKIILESKKMPIVFNSSHTENTIINQCKQICNYGYLNKSFNPYLLDDAIKDALSKWEKNGKRQHL